MLDPCFTEKDRLYEHDQNRYVVTYQKNVSPRCDPDFEKYGTVCSLEENEQSSSGGGKTPCGVRFFRKWRNVYLQTSYSS